VYPGRARDAGTLPTVPTAPSRPEEPSDGAASAGARAARGFTVADLLPPPDRRSQWRRLPRLIRSAFALVAASSRRELITTIVLQVISGGALALQLLIARQILQGLTAISRGEAGATDLVPEFTALIVGTVFVGVCQAFTQHQQRLLTELVGQHAFSRIIGTASEVDLASYEDPRFFDQLQRARTSGMSRPIQMVNSVVSLLTAALTSAGVAVALATVEPLLLPLAALAAVPLLLVTLRNSREAYVFEYAMTAESRERLYLMELLTGRESAKEIRAFSATAFLLSRYTRLTDERLVRMRAFLRGRLRVSVIGAVGSALAAAVALGSLVLLLDQGRISVADALTAGIALQLLSSRLSAITGNLGQLVETGLFLDDYHRFLALGERLEAAVPTPAAAPVPLGRLQVDGLSFRYPGTERTVLEDVSLEIGKGEVVALVGQNGSGKTTLVKLICQLYAGDTGTVRWLGPTGEPLDPDTVRESITVLFQDFVQYHLSARDNIALGRVGKAPDDAEIREAARQAGAEAFLDRLPQGLDSRLGRQFYGGQELSVGQWQRLALARAFFRGGDFLVLDEPTASLDPKAEEELFARMRELSAGRSVLLISHRFSSVRAADRIYVLEDGRITERGSHDELVALGGHYAELFKLQAAAYL
jgi:ATP-binding cassette, subfamily B, bacterial